MTAIRSQTASPESKGSKVMQISKWKSIWRVPDMKPRGASGSVGYAEAGGTIYPMSPGNAALPLLGWLDSGSTRHPFETARYGMSGTAAGTENLDWTYRYEPRTPLGRRLMDIRKRIIASGQPLLDDWDDLDREVAERRGGQAQGEYEADVR